MKNFNMFLLLLIVCVKVFGQSNSISNYYDVNQQVPIGGSSLFYVQIINAPQNAIITRVDAKFDYIAYGVVQNYVSARFNRNSDPGPAGGAILVSQGNLEAGNPGSTSYVSFNDWNGSSVNSDYYFRFSLTSASQYTFTIQKIYVTVYYNSSSLTVTFPNGGENLTKGGDYTIRWTTQNVTGNIQIDLYKKWTSQQYFVKQLAASAPDIGSYPFNPPSDLSDANDYYIGISAMGGTISDFSDQPFTIQTAQSYSDDYPYSTYDYNLPDPWLFYYRECTSYVAFKINKDAGTLKEPYFFTNYMKSGHWGNAGNWGTNAVGLGYTVDNIPIKGAVAQWDEKQMPPIGHVAYVEEVNQDGSVNLTEYNYPSGHKFNIRMGVKNAPNFIHIINTAQVSIIVTNPQSGYTWNNNSKVKVEWDYSVYSGNIAVDIYKGGEQSNQNLVRAVSSVPVSNKSVEIDLANLPNGIVLEPGIDYKIGISATPSGDPWAFSDFFAIRKLTITYPNGGQTFNQGQVINVKWNFDFVTDDIAIDLYKGETNVSRLASGIAVNDGNEDVTIPSGISYDSDYRIAISSYGGYVWDYSDNNFAIMQSSNSTVILDELDGSTLGNSFGVSYTNTPNNQGAVFSRASESRIEYPFSMGLPHEGTIEMQIKVTKGYSYSNYVLEDNQSYAIIFNTGPSDVWYLGAMWLTVDNTGGISLATALTAGPTSHALSASNTTFRFNEWHIISFSYGNQGQYINIDGKLVASNEYYTETLQTCGNWYSTRDIPTVGEIKSVFWDNNQWDQGFEGILDCFRASTAQQDWELNVTDVKEVYVHLPQNYSLSQNYPNPFNPSTNISYSIPQTCKVILKIFDVIGKEVTTLVDEEKTDGNYTIEFNSEKFNLPSGIYFYRLQAGKFSETKKLVLME